MPISVSSALVTVSYGCDADDVANGHVASSGYSVVTGCCNDPNSRMAVNLMGRRNRAQPLHRRDQISHLSSLHKRPIGPHCRLASLVYCCTHRSRKVGQTPRIGANEDHDQSPIDGGTPYLGGGVCPNREPSLVGRDICSGVSSVLDLVVCSGAVTVTTGLGARVATRLVLGAALSARHAPDAAVATSPGSAVRPGLLNTVEPKKGSRRPVAATLTEHSRPNSDIGIGFTQGVVT